MNIFAQVMYTFYFVFTTYTKAKSLSLNPDS